MKKVKRSTLKGKNSTLTVGKQLLSTKKKGPATTNLERKMYDYLAMHVKPQEFSRWVIVTNSVLAESPRFNDLKKRCSAGFFLYRLASEFIPKYMDSRINKAEKVLELRSVFGCGEALEDRMALECIGGAYFDNCKGRMADWIEKYTRILNVLIHLHEMYWGDEYWAVPAQEEAA